MTFEHLSRAELTDMLEELLGRFDAARVRSDREVADRDRLLNSLQVHQVELEMQNRELREVQGALEEARDRYAELYDFAPVAYCAFDRRGVVREANLTAARMFGRERDQVLETQFIALVKLERATDFFDHLDRCAEQRAARVDALSFRTRQGSLHAEVVSVPIVDGNGEVTGFRSAFTDITQRRMAEQAREQALASERRLRARFEALDEANLAVARVLASDARFSMNSLLMLIAERARMIASAEHAAILLSTGDRADSDRPQAARTPRDGSEQVEIPLELRDRTLGTLCIKRQRSAGELTADDRRTLEMLAERAATAIDIVGLSRLEARERARLTMVEHATFELSAAHDLEATWQAVRRVSERTVPELADCCMLYIAVRDELRPFGAWHRDPDAGKLLAALHEGRAVQRDESSGVLAEAFREAKLVLAQAPFQLWARAPDQDRLQLKSVLAVPLVARQRVFGVLCLGLSEGQRAFQQAHLGWADELALLCALAMDTALLFDDLQAAVRARETLLSLVSHDLRGPLSAIALSAAALEPHDQGPDRRRSSKHISLIKRSASWMDLLISDLLTAGQIQEGCFLISVEPQGALLLVQEAVEFARPVAQSKGIELSLAVAPELPQVAGDRLRVLQVLSNLIGNALKFTPRGGVVEIGAESRGALVEFWVSDTGPGIPVHQLLHLFERYWTGAQDGRRHGHGLGLGLFIAKSIVDAHHGRIWADRAPEGGASFRFTLPAVDGASARTETTEAGAVLHASGTNTLR